MITFTVLFQLYEGSGVRLEELTLNQWIDVVCGGVISSIMMLLALLYLVVRFLDGEYSQLYRSVVIAAITCIVLAVYAAGAIVSYNIRMNLGQTRNDASSHAVSSLFDVAGQFVKVMFEKKDMPITNAWHDFEALTQTPKTSSPVPSR